jgi:two-component system nitrate/nitrite response regulator NarL
MDRPDGIRILIADDHTIFRTGVRSLLDAEPDFVVVGEARCGNEAVQMSRSLRPDILLLDMAMPGGSGVDALGQLATSACPVRTILLTASIESSEIVKVLRLGAAGVVLDSIRRVVAGEALGVSVEESPSPTRFGLTPRQIEITSAVVSGFSNKEIAKRFALSEDTVKHHLTNIFDKIGASNRLELALFAVHHRVVENREPNGR